MAQHFTDAPEIARKPSSREVSEGSIGLSAVHWEGVFSWSRVSGAQHRVSLSLAPHLAHCLVQVVGSLNFFLRGYTSEGKNIVYGPGWRFHDVSHRRGSPLDGKCLQGKVQVMRKVFEERVVGVNPAVRRLIWSRHESLWMTCWSRRIWSRVLFLSSIISSGRGAVAQITIID